MGLDFDYVTIFTIWVSASIVLMPIAGLTLRYTLVPIIGALTDWRHSRCGSLAESRLRTRVDELERRLRLIESAGRRSGATVHRIETSPAAK